jgi:hypothetical protein
MSMQDRLLSPESVFTKTAPGMDNRKILRGFLLMDKVYALLRRGRPAAAAPAREGSRRHRGQA